ncbi:MULTISPECIES: carboxymuconolactone decarboxylase family protein [unclassified Burkholderia]|uniref:carboxymuconolactone decarboxylase family protein n=1 Tax=unclassified Burkholderia TaxID=2613784 RepID=UPI0014208CCA|nr:MULTISPECIES: carboxymuconolactone decarboxylase family protein [unclassified Burkholderia]NIE82307.1 carboxymuconolactone decarboxylase family protein [Burkholderia sp. Tr-860]NIF62806.1 carboxymuconolactone decarboxylase family protein [Burkholderia sp. Cy-647]NIF71169.1 carboxymuconolactone decarboxylase family protein [Burkholderia sp. Ap-962]NIF94607.1 carboxymuconolactone decarboxylase family protein [Burkholderia sp. Ax-1720]
MADIKPDPAVLKNAFGDASQIDPEAARRARTYLDMAGFVPPRVQTRLAVTGALDPTMLSLQEAARDHALAPACFDEKTTQLMVFGIMLGQLNDAAQMHGIAARRAGASWEELQAVINLCYLFRGVPAANRGADMLAAIAMREAEASGQ